MSRIHAIMNGTAPLHSLQPEKGHLLANSPSAASLTRRLSQVRFGHGRPGDQALRAHGPDIRVERMNSREKRH